MTQESIATLNTQFGRGNTLLFDAGRAGLTRVVLRHDEAILELYLNGAHITRYCPAKNREVLWMSNSAVYQRGQSLRGGIPLCWPWFGAHAKSDRPQHGYARTASFSVQSTHTDSESTSIVLSLAANETPYPEWQDKAQLEIEIKLSDSLWMELRTKNLSNQPLIVSNALHTYFSITGRQKISIPGLTHLTYLDKPRNYAAMVQSAPIVIEGEIDRVYCDPPATLQMFDAGHAATTTIQSWGNNNIVVWNPGETNARTMPDFDDQGFEKMLCIEPANACEQWVELRPHGSHCLGQQISFSTDPIR